MIETMENDKNLYIFSNGIKISKQVLEKYPDLFNYYLEYETSSERKRGAKAGAGLPPTKKDILLQSK